MNWEHLRLTEAEPDEEARYRNTGRWEHLRLPPDDVGRLRGLVGQVARGSTGMLAATTAGLGALAEPLAVVPTAGVGAPPEILGQALQAIGTKTQQAVEQAFPVHTPREGQVFGTWPETIVGGAATAGTLLGVGILTGLAGIPAALATIPVGAFAQSEMMYQDALASTDDEGTAQLARIIGLPIGAIEGLGELGVLGRMDRVAGGALSRKATSLVPKFMSKYVTKTAGKVAIAAGGLEEMLEELIQGGLENLTARELYDSSRSITDHLAEQGGAGLVIGVVANAVGLKIGRMLRSPGLSATDQDLLQHAQAQVEQAKLTVAEDLVRRFPDTTVEYWQGQMVQPEEMTNDDAVRMAQTKVVDDIRNGSHAWQTDNEAVQQNVKAEIDRAFAPTQARGEQFAQLQEYNADVAAKRADYAAQVEAGTYAATTKAAQASLAKLQKAAADINVEKHAQIVAADIDKRLAKEIPKPTAPKGLNKLERKQVQAELKKATNAVLDRMCRNTDGSTQAKRRALSLNREVIVNGNRLTINATDARGSSIPQHRPKGNASSKDIILTSDQMDDAFNLFTGIDSAPMEAKNLKQNTLAAFGVVHDLSDMDAVVHVANTQADFDLDRYRTGLNSLLAAGVAQDTNRKLVELAHLMEATNDLNKVSRRLGKLYQTPAPGQQAKVKPIGAKDRNLISALTVLRKRAGQPGVLFGDTLVDGMQDKELLEAGYKTRFVDAVYNVLRQTSKSDAAIRNRMRRIERYLDEMQLTGFSDIKLNAAETQAATNLRAIYDDIWNVSKEVGVITDKQYDEWYLENYLPVQWNIEAIEQEQRQREVINRIAQAKQVPIEQAREWYQRFIRSKRDRINYNLEHERQLQGIPSDIKGLQERTYRYIEEASRRIAHVKHFGKRDVKLNDLIATMRTNHQTHGDYAKAVMDNALALNPQNASAMREAKDFAKVRSTIAADFLTWSWLQNLTEPALLTFRFNLRDTIKTSVKLLANSKELSHMAAESAAIPVATRAQGFWGRVFSRTWGDYLTQHYGAKEEGAYANVVQWSMLVTGFTPTERFGKILAANTAIEYANRQLRALAKNPKNSYAKARLAELVNTVDGFEAESLMQAIRPVLRYRASSGNDTKTSLQKLAGSRNADIALLAKNAQVLAGIRGIDDVGIGPTGQLRRPLTWTNSAWGQLLTQFQSWSYQVTRMAKEELRKGGVRAWLKMGGVFLPTAVVVSTAERLAQSLLFARDLPEDEVEWLFAAIEAPFHLGLASFFWRAMVTAANRPEDIGDIALPPAMRPARAPAYLFQDLTRGEISSRTVEEFLGLAPVVGRPVAGRMRKARRQGKKGLYSGRKQKGVYQ